jgi:hypothetical protein
MYCNISECFGLCNAHFTARLHVSDMAPVIYSLPTDVLVLLHSYSAHAPRVSVTDHGKTPPSLPG